MSTYYTTPYYNYGNIKLTAGGTGGSGGTYYTTSTTSPTWSIANNSNSAMAGEVRILGDAVFEGNIKWQDRDMREWFESVESRLAILQPNTKLEAEYEELAEIGRQYKELEKRLLEKQRVFDILKKPLD